MVPDIDHSRGVEPPDGWDEMGYQDRKQWLADQPRAAILEEAFDMAGHESSAQGDTLVKEDVAVLLMAMGGPRQMGGRAASD